SIGGMEVRTITPAYFALMGIPIRRGRSFADTDTGTAPPVILVNETLARRWWGDASPIGDRIVIGRIQGRDTEVLNPPRQVVGVVADTKTAFLKEPAWSTVYIPAAQLTESMARGTGGMSWILRGSATAGVAGELRKAIREMDPSQRRGEVRPM